MEQFQHQMDHMDVASEAVMTQLDQTTDDQIAQSDVSQLISQVAAEHELALDGEFQQFRAPTDPVAQTASTAAPADPSADADVEARLARLLGGS